MRFSQNDRSKMSRFFHGKCCSFSHSIVSSRISALLLLFFARSTDEWCEIESVWWIGIWRHLWDVFRKKSRPKTKSIDLPDLQFDRNRWQTIIYRPKTSTQIAPFDGFELNKTWLTADVIITTITIVLSSWSFMMLHLRSVNDWDPVRDIQNKRRNEGENRITQGFTWFDWHPEMVHPTRDFPQDDDDDHHQAAKTRCATLKFSLQLHRFMWRKTK